MYKQYSPVGPLAVLRFLKDHDMLGDYLLVLAHEVASDPVGWRSLLDDFQGRIILDNGVIELGAPVSRGAMLQAIDITQARTVVLPDVLEHPQDTVRGSYYTASNLRQEGYGGHFMGVPQGQNMGQMMWCMQQLAMDCEVTRWGVPRWWANKYGTRMPLVRMLGGGYTNARDTEIHLLGMSENLHDDIYCANQDGVVGIDSANPLILGYMQEHLSKEKNYRHVGGPPKEEYWKIKSVPECDWSAAMEFNVREMRRLINKGLGECPSQPLHNSLSAQ